MKTSYKFIFIACLLGLLTACQSTSTSFSSEKQKQINNAATSESKAKNEATTEKAENESIVESKQVIDGFSNPSLRAVPLTSSASLTEEQGKASGDGFADSPALNADKSVGWVVNPGLNYEFVNPQTNTTRDLATLQPTADFLKDGEINPDKVQQYVLTDNGVKVGTFQFVNQSYSSYATFVPEKTLSEDYGDGLEERSYQNLEMYVINPTQKAQFNLLEGTATYTGHTLGYVDGVEGKTPKKPYVGDIELSVDFAQKEISGRVFNRQDGFTKYHWRFTDDDEQPTEKGISLTKQDLILKPTKVEAVNGVMVFGVGAHDNVVVNDDGKEVSISSYSGAFAGPRAEEVVGSIGNGEEKIIFGAAKE
ncbi:transferrin-binding protein-like solute binding protein [Gallibacterium salpingitidis]|uniref:transferrin-binding protein-like solute binding protein n=1 Tax=Gallibacterium salpingitidis TaxID=505341 RepID=UPI00266FDC9B|nr:transferrin-binding protein-like solute binding protein [Gallibacterium salpingitidis]WKS99847.1 transferrin-binding protein-like solute binding protein [Gallibacterium salpingitidis]